MAINWEMVGVLLSVIAMVVGGIWSLVRLGKWIAGVGSLRSELKEVKEENSEIRRDMAKRSRLTSDVSHQVDVKLNELLHALLKERSGD